MKISFSWLYANANKIAMEINKDAKRTPKSAITCFIRIYGIKLRRVQRKKQAHKSSFLPQIMAWHSTLREELIKTARREATFDFKWGRFKAIRRFNVDQVPLPFAVDRKKTYDVPVPTEQRREYRT